jgi:cytoskeletal protein CcmA (bactofilin family)
MTPRPRLPWIALLAACAVRGAVATEFKATERFEVAPDAIVSNEVWLQAQTIAIEGTTLDDVFMLAAGAATAHATHPVAPIRVTGAVGGDLWAAGESVEISGTVSTHARLAAGKLVRLTGTVGGNLMAAGSAIRLETGSRVGGSALLAGSEILLNGTINGPTRVYAAKATLAGRFNGDVTLTATDIVMMPGTHVAGNLYYRMDKDLIPGDGVVVEGKLERLTPKPAAARPTSHEWMWVQLGLLAGAMLAGIAFVSLLPGIVALSVHKFTESYWRSLAFGFIAFALIPMVAFFLLFTLIGIPLSLLMMMAYGLLLYLSKLITALFLGHLLLGRGKPLPATRLYPALALGLLVIYAAVNLPFPFDIVGWFALTLPGLGAFVAAILDRRIPVMVATPQPPSGDEPPPLPGMPPSGAA